MPRQATAAPGLDAAAATASANSLSPRASPQSAEAAAASQTLRVTPYAATGVDSSSPEAFIRSVAPYAQRVSQATGIPAEALIGMAANETGYGRFAEGNNLFGIKGTGPAGSFSTQTWEDYGDGRVTIVDNFRGYHSVAESFVDFAKLVTTSQRYQGAMGQTTVEGFVDGLRRGGYMTDPDYVQKISAITTHYSATIKESLRAGGTPVATLARTSAPVSRPQAGGPSAGVKVPDQFNVGLAPDEAYAACGPVAAVAFAQAYGRNPTPAEALELAKQSGWTAGGGMNGIANEKRLLDKMQLPSRLEMGANWDHIKADALRKQPVIISTPGHYFVVDGYDASNGTYHVGQSGKVYRGGSEWMTPAQIEAAGGAPSGALFTDHPLVIDRPVLPPLQVAGQRPVLPPLQVAGQRPVLPPLQTAVSPAPLIAAPTAPIASRLVLAADPSVLAQLQPPVVAPPGVAAPPAAPPTPPDPWDLNPGQAAASVGPPAPPVVAAPPGPPDRWDLNPGQAAASVGTPAPIAASASLIPPEPLPTSASLIPPEPRPTSAQLSPSAPLPASPSIGTPEPVQATGPLIPREPIPALAPGVDPSLHQADTEPPSLSPAEEVLLASTLLDLPPPAAVPVQPKRSFDESAGPAAAPYARAATPDVDSPTVNVPIDSLGLPAEPAPAQKSTVLSPGAEAGLAVGAVAAAQPGPDPRQEPPPPPRPARGLRRPDEEEDIPPPPSPAVEDRAPRV